MPLFRHALENWLPHLYNVVVFHRGALSAEQSEIVESIQAAAPHANLTVRTVDLGKGDQGWAAEVYTGGTLPRIVLLTASPRDLPPPGPLAWTAQQIVWSGPLTKASAAVLLDSPARGEIARRIRSGESAVWVMLECGDRAKDAGAAGLIAGRIAELAEKLRLPEPGTVGTSGTRPSDNLPKLRLAFSMVRVSRSDPAERVFAGMLLSCSEGLRDLDSPILFPIFGRGRVLRPLAGEDIDAANITQTARDLIDQCSCQVQARFPGTDMLIAADWESEVTQSAAIQQHEETSDGLTKIILVTLAGIAFAVLAVIAVVKRRLDTTASGSLLLAAVLGALASGGCGTGIRKQRLAECQVQLDEARAALKSDSRAELYAGLWSTNETLLALDRNKSFIDPDKWAEMDREARQIRTVLGRRKVVVDARTRIDTARKAGDTDELLAAIRDAMKRPDMPKSLLDTWAAEMKPLQEKSDFARISKLLKDGKKTQALEELSVFVKTYPRNLKARLIKEGLENE